jgi:hypothetical protein
MGWLFAKVPKQGGNELLDELVRDLHLPLALYESKPK